MRAPANEPQQHAGTEIITEADRKRSERDNIIAALRTCKGKVFGSNGAAELLGVKPTTLTSRIKRYGIDRYRFKT